MRLGAQLTGRLFGIAKWLYMTKSCERDRKPYRALGSDPERHDEDILMIN